MVSRPRCGGHLSQRDKPLHESDTIAHAYKLFARYSFRAIPILGEGGILKGAVPYRDVMQLNHRLV